MRFGRLAALVMAGVAVLAVGCKKNEVDKGAFKSALNNYLSAQKQCLFAAPIKFPVQADTKDDEQTKHFDALTDAGLLARKAEEKKRFLVGSKQVNDYDLSDQGRGAWTADASQPGYGNFCYGQAEVSSIDSWTPDTADAAQYQVSYHWDLSHLPAWANSAEMKTAFPKLNAAANPMTGTASLVKGTDGWVVGDAQPAGNMPPSAQ